MLLLLLNLSIPVFSQTIPELVFQNPVLVAGSASQDGAIYRFSTVGPNLDAEVEILGRSDVQVVLSSIDTIGAGLGYNKAFQPVIGMPGIAPANTNWWMRFKITFYEAGNNKKVKMSQFNVTGLDIDGDGANLFEWAEMDRIGQIDSAQTNSLTFSLLADHENEKDYKITGITANSPGIDTNALNVMATYTYLDKDNFEFVIGAQTTASGTSAGMRLNAIWFKQFNLAPLPVKVISFSAMLIDNKSVLNWRTVSEMSLSHFVVEKSTDGKNYKEAGIVFSNGNETDITNYSFSDNISNKESGIFYYRLRSVDIDGKSKYSETRIIRIGKQQEAISILTFPNPVSNELRVTIPGNWQNRQVVYEVFNASGLVVKKKEIAVSSQTETLNISNLSRGYYIVRVKCEGAVAQQRIIKN